MSKKMLIDSCHSEETRIVVVSEENNIEEFDFETTHKKQLKGNIYLAKVTRIEPSLQAAFVDYGGNRHGFLAFSDIHPDYYQIPHADKVKLLDKEKEDSVIEEVESENEDEKIEEIGDDTAELISQQRPQNVKKKYSIHEVIKKNQIMLIQIVKEERGNKGAAVTTYLSLAGRYSVLMPNTPRGSAISKKVANSKIRNHLKEIIKTLQVPQGMGVILRTAGANRTKTEIKRDYEYLLRFWDNIRSLTLTSLAPTLIYEEGNLIKRSIRDLYSKDIAEILVYGDIAYKEAKTFMRMLMPSHAKVVQPYKDEIPLFTKYNIEEQLDVILQPVVNLKSGGYLVIEQTEALVSIDVNSGKATKEASIEKTALQTNLEAAAEVARQLRLRDLSGLVIIDFIDMEDRSNIRNVEKTLRDCLKTDRARIQVGKISHFGLIEMSRQRLRSSVLESTTQICSTCKGAGYVRSPISIAIYILRKLEERLLKDSSYNLRVKTSAEYAIYFYNKKKVQLNDLEKRFNVTITLEIADVSLEKLLIIEKTSLANPTLQNTNKTKKITKDKIEAEKLVEDIGVEKEAESKEEEKPIRKKRKTPRKKVTKEKKDNNTENIIDKSDEAKEASLEAVVSEEVENTPKEEKKPKKTGWWQKRKNAIKEA